MCMWGEYSKVGGVARGKAKCWPVAFMRKNSYKVVVFTAHLGCKCPSLVLLEEPSSKGFSEPQYLKDIQIKCNI